jgi:hypothetical protein
VISEPRAWANIHKAQEAQFGRGRDGMKGD